MPSQPVRLYQVYFSLRVSLFCMTRDEQLVDDSWYVVCCAAWGRMALVFAIMNLYNFKKKRQKFLSIPFLYFSLIWY